MANLRSRLDQAERAAQDAARDEYRQAVRAFAVWLQGTTTPAEFRAYWRVTGRQLGKPAAEIARFGDVAPDDDETAARVSARIDQAIPPDLETRCTRAVDAMRALGIPFEGQGQ